ncbi:MAG: hypothetical protein ACFFD4_04390 [Candidatus Odinarchaeota archaeon]
MAPLFIVNSFFIADRPSLSGMPATRRMFEPFEGIGGCQLPITAGRRSTEQSG